MHFLSLTLVLLVGATSAQDYFREPEKLVRGSHSVGDGLGSYAFTYETEGGILQQEQGTRKHAGTEHEAQLIQGSVQYNAPDGTPISLSWTADEYGTQVSGSHLPTPPPIPPEIQRALEWIAKQPTTEEPKEYSESNDFRAKTHKEQKSPDHHQFGKIKKARN